MGFTRRPSLAAARGAPRLVVVAVSLMILGLVAAACVPGRSGIEGANAETETVSETQTDAIPEKPDQLVTAFNRDSIICDGTDRELGEVRGALPGERILFASPAPVSVPETNADQSGRFKIAWNCDPSEARLQWEIRALGHDSGREVTFTIVGSSAEAAGEGGLTIDVPNEQFTCDGFAKQVGSISNAFAAEQIVFTSPESSNIRPGAADEFGMLNVNWECEPGEIGTTWNITATGADSGRVTTFVIVGVGVTPTEIEDLAVSVTEDPFACDGVTRTFATVGNFAPQEVVDFSSPDSENLIDSSADGNGDIDVRWQCGLDDVGKIWRLTATGVSSQRTVTMVITGGIPADIAAIEPVVTYVENPFGCDGSSRPFATITNLVPLEFVDFVSPQSEGLRQGQADGAGTLAVKWQCGAADIDMIWDITATGATSGRSTTLQVTGVAPISG